MAGSRVAYSWWYNQIPPIRLTLIAMKILSPPSWGGQQFKVFYLWSGGGEKGVFTYPSPNHGTPLLKKMQGLGNGLSFLKLWIRIRPIFGYWIWIWSDIILINVVENTRITSGSELFFFLTGYGLFKLLDPAPTCYFVNQRCWAYPEDIRIRAP